MDKNEAPGHDPQVKPRRFNMPAQRHEDAHHDGQYENCGKLVEEVGHFRNFQGSGEPKFNMANLRKCLLKESGSDLGNPFCKWAVGTILGKPTFLTPFHRSRYTANTAYNRAKSYDPAAQEGD
jgi:hypothetical protein